MTGRVEDPPLITGSGRFVEDHVDEDTLWAGFVRSHLPHGRIVSVESHADADGIFVFMAEDLGLEPQPGKLRPSLPGHVDYRRPVLADSVVRFEGEAVALVVAPSEAALADAMEAVWIDLEPLPSVVDVDSALEDRVVLHPIVGTNRAVTGDWATPELPVWGDVPEISLVVEHPRVAPLPMEPLTLLADPRGNRLVLRAGTQTPLRLRSAVSASLGISEADVRVVVPEVGGAFGQKGAVYVEYLAVARAAQLLGRPVVWAQRRRDNLAAATHGRGARHVIRLGGTPDGRLTQAEIDIIGDLGAYPQMGGVVPLTSGAVAAGPYKFDRFAVRTVGVLTNRTPTGPYRGAGRPEATFTMERAVDAFARHIGVDPLEVRRKSLLPAHSGVVSATGQTYDSGDYAAALEIANRSIRPAEVRRRRDELLRTGARISVGAAVTVFIERAGGPTEFGESAKISVDENGLIRLIVGTAPTGQGHATAFGRLAARVFGMEGDDVTVSFGDSDALAEGGGTYGSRSAQLGGSAVSAASSMLVELCKSIASEVLEVDVSDVVVVGGSVAVRGVPDSAISLRDVHREAGKRGVELTVTERFAANAQTFPSGAHGVVARVDLDTGDVTVERVVAVDDCGVILDPMLARGQVHGSLAQGFGQAMSEAIGMTEEGLMATGTLMSYLAPRAADVPRWELHHVTTPSPTNPLGVKGIGESGTIGLPAAIVNAVLDALAPLGVTDLSIPLTSASVWKAIEGARAGRSE